MKIKQLASVLLASAAPLLWSSLVMAKEVNIYSSRQEALIAPILERFTKETGITVNLVTGGDDALIERLKNEGARSPADLLFTADAGRLYRAKQLNLLQKIDSPVLQRRIPAHFRDADNQWFGLAVRARPIMYVKGKVNPAELSTYEALADAKWQGRICVRSSSHIYNQSLVAALTEHIGAEKTLAWAKGFVANFARTPSGGDRDQIKAAAVGVCDIAVANTYYLGGMFTSKTPEDKAAAEKIGVFWPNQKSWGAHVNISGGGVTASAQHKEEAIKLMEFLVSDEAQHWYAEANQEYPVVPGIKISAVLQSFGKFKEDEISLNKLGEGNAQAVKLMDEAGWK